MQIALAPSSAQDYSQNAAEDGSLGNIKFYLFPLTKKEPATITNPITAIASPCQSTGLSNVFSIADANSLA
jgi:hypothetical protein